jgi:hypothetical protein
MQTIERSFENAKYWKGGLVFIIEGSFSVKIE